MLSGRVLITGGSGYLGRGILRRAVRENWPADIVVLSRDELKQSQCKKKYLGRAQYILGDIRDSDMLRNVLCSVDTIIHTAALKYVPEGEWNVSECISVNISGTQNIINHARWLDRTKKVVVVSTDKAVTPANVYGMSKALCERLVGESALYESPKVTGVRYGNVVGSTGSVVPEFIRQYKETGRVSVTDEYMTRFWLGVDDAIDLILTALDIADSGEVRPGSLVVPKPKSMLLGSLVRALVPKAEIVATGLRPGEKMHETLLTVDESRYTVGLDYGLFELPALKYRKLQKHHAFELSSSEAEPMDPDDFLALVEDSYSV